MPSNGIKIALFFSFILNGCYTTAPIHWSEHRDRDVIQSKTIIPNGSRLDFLARSDARTLSIKSVDIPLCRAVEKGYPIIKESGQREPHAWPATLFGVGLTGGGVALLADGLSRDSNEGEMKLIETLSGIGVAAVGAIIVGKCGLTSTCEPDADMEYKYKNGSNFERWESDRRSDCSGKQSKPIGGIPILLSTTWENSNRKIKWNKQFTNDDGIADIPIMEIIRSVSAHCGVAKTVFQADTLNRQDVEDSPSNPSTSRDESGEYVINTKAGPIASPKLIRDEIARSIATECALDSQRKCAGSRSASIEDRCKIDCNSQSGAAYCEEQKKLELQMPGISDDERNQIDQRYTSCVSEHKIDTSASGNCAADCTSKALSVICPNPWEAN